MTTAADEPATPPTAAGAALPARAAAVRGDDFQYTLGWFHACQALLDPNIISVSIEDADARSFDDIAVLRQDGRHLYRQAKNSNYGNVPLSEDWLLGSTGKGKPPLQHYYDSWTAVSAGSTPAWHTAAGSSPWTP